MLKLNIGCGRNILPRAEGWINLDIYPLPGVDIQHDIQNPFPFPDNHFDYIQAIHTIEHVSFEKKVSVIEEIWRIAKPGAQVHIEVPNAYSAWAWCDPTHKSAWAAGNMFYFSENEGNFEYYSRACFHIIQEKICGEGTPPKDLIWDMEVIKPPDPRYTRHERGKFWQK